MSKPAKPIIAIMYDFDKTLSTKDMQEFAFIPKLGMTADDFWHKSEEIARKENMDPINAYLYVMLRAARDKQISVTRDKFVELGRNIEYYPGVLEWFDLINNFGKENKVQIEHYIISSGLKEIIEGSSLAHKFKKIYACEFYYDENGVAAWPKLTVNYTNKTQFLFRINKGVLDVYEDKKLNNYTPDNERRIPFRNMIYIGDGLTDVPCMKLVKLNGGQSIAVFKNRKKQTAKQLLNEKRVDFITKADYSSDGELYNIVCNIIKKMAMEDNLVRVHSKHLKSIQE